MKIIEDSNIVYWAEYPEYICAVVGKTLIDLHNARTLELMPAGSDFIWLLDKAPSIKNGKLSITDTNINGMGTIYSEEKGSCEVLEVHFKPRPKPTLKSSKEKECLV